MNHFPNCCRRRSVSTSRRRCSNTSTATTGSFGKPPSKKTLYERGDWHGLQRLARERITSYDERVKECVELLEDEYDAENIDDEVWQQIKLHYIGLLTSHRQPECAETFFNSVCCKILHRSYFNNDFIFVRPAISTEYLENDEPAAKPTYRAYYPGTDGLAATLERIVTNFQLEPPFEDLTRDIGCVMQAIDDEFGQFDAAPNFQIHVLSSLFFRNKSAYIIGRIINADRVLPFAMPIRHVRAGVLAVDTVLLRRELLQVIFSFSHSYFWSTWACRPRTWTSSAPSCPASRRPRSTRRWACRSRARTCSTAICCTICRIRATASSSRPASRAS
jgi:isocitrate dehydrogenase kinase/phosphatase